MGGMMRLGLLLALLAWAVASCQAAGCVPCQPLYSANATAVLPSNGTCPAITPELIALLKADGKDVDYTWPEANTTLGDMTNPGDSNTYAEQCLTDRSSRVQCKYELVTDEYGDEPTDEEIYNFYFPQCTTQACTDRSKDECICSKDLSFNCGCCWCNSAPGKAAALGGVLAMAVAALLLLWALRVLVVAC